MTPYAMKVATGQLHMALPMERPEPIPAWPFVVAWLAIGLLIYGCRAR